MIEMKFCLQCFYFHTCGAKEATMTPTNPAHWLAENLERHVPSMVLPVTSNAATNGSNDLANSNPYFMAVSISLGDTNTTFSFLSANVLLE